METIREQIEDTFISNNKQLDDIEAVVEDISTRFAEWLGFENNKELFAEFKKQNNL